MSSFDTTELKFSARQNTSTRNHVLVLIHITQEKNVHLRTGKLNKKMQI